MLAHPTQERLTALGLSGMAKALEDQRRQPDISALSFEERLALLLDREVIERENKRLVTRLRLAALRQEAIVEDKSASGFNRNRCPASPESAWSRSACCSTGLLPYYRSGGAEQSGRRRTRPEACREDRQDPSARRRGMAPAAREHSD